MKAMKADHRSVWNWPNMNPAVSSILQSGCELFAEYKLLTRGVNRQGRSKRPRWERENPISVTHSRSRMNPAHELYSNTSLLTRGHWLNKRTCSGADHLLFFQISSGCLRWPAPCPLTPSHQTCPPETPLPAETPPSVPPTHGSPSSSTALGRSLASRWGQSGCMPVTVTSTLSITWSG